MVDSSYYWFIVILITLFISFLLKFILNLLFSTTNNNKLSLPPGPSPLPVIGNLLWLRNSSQFESVLRGFKAKYGPVISLRFGPRPSVTVFVGSHDLAYKALVQNGVVFSDRPEATVAARVMNSNQHQISSAAYGPTWRLLRRNLTSEILHPSRVKSYSGARRWVLGILLRRFLQQGEEVAVKVIDHFRHGMFCLLLLMCFGDKLPEQQIHEIESVLHRLLVTFNRFQILGLFPRLGKLLFRGRWKELLECRREQEQVLIPPIRARIEATRLEKADADKNKKNSIVAYLDTLVDLQLPEDKRKPHEGELVSMCSEFLNAGTDTTSTTLQWIMANLVKHPTIQQKLYEEIVQVVGPSPALKTDIAEDDMGVVEEVDLEKMPYLKAIVLEGLRRHPPGHFVLPHAVTEDVEVNGYLVPKKAVVNFLVAEMGLDPEVWEDPMEFKPERFLAGQEKENDRQVFDITCTREIKMMPFGAGRRICPAANLALLHLEYFVANLIWYFEWKEVDGHEVDLSEKQEFTTVMKNPLNARILPRVKS